MTVIDLAFRKTHAAARPAIVARMTANVARYFRAWRNRRAFYRLGNLSDRELKDIGLTRADLFVAGTGTFGADPTTRLRMIVDARQDL
jgi:uncharacterized protein YjiS (DUF1127 family)